MLEAGIEPAPYAWEAYILPLNYSSSMEVMDHICIDILQSTLALHYSCTRQSKFSYSIEDIIYFKTRFFQKFVYWRYLGENVNIHKLSRCTPSEPAWLN